MNTYTQEELNEILRLHKMWIDGEDGGERTDLGGADLGGADLGGADLGGADLAYADLSDTVLRGADLTDAVLRGSDMRGAKLGGTVLRGADLCNTIGNRREIKTVQTDIWTATYTYERMQIGCKNHAIKDWWGFDDDTISKMDCRALDWWKRWKPILQQIIEISPAVATGHEQVVDGEGE